MIIRENCIVCENPIHRSSNGGGLKTRRRTSDVTCSSKCSRIYKRVFKFAYEKIKRLEKKNLNMLKLQKQELNHF